MVPDEIEIDVEVEQPPSTPPPLATKKNKRLRIALGVALLLVVVVGVWLALRLSPEEEKKLTETRRAAIESLTLRLRTLRKNYPPPEQLRNEQPCHGVSLPTPTRKTPALTVDLEYIERFTNPLYDHDKDIFRQFRRINSPVIQRFEPLHEIDSITSSSVGDMLNEVRSLDRAAYIIVLHSSRTVGEASGKDILTPGVYGASIVIFDFQNGTPLCWSSLLVRTSSSLALYQYSDPNEALAEDLNTKIMNELASKLETMLQ